MNIAIIGRSEMLFESARALIKEGHNIELVITAKEVPEYTKTTKDFEALAKDSGAVFLYSPEITKDEIEDALNDVTNLDIGVSVNYPTILPVEIIKKFKHGILNAHGGDLPRYRGNACQAWAILNGEDKIGLCIHKMVAGDLDSGAIIARDYFNINLNTKITAVYQWICERIPYLFIDALDKLGKDQSFLLEEQSKIPRDALRCYPRIPEDGRIDWSKSAIENLRLINACNKPYAGAFGELEGEKLIIWDAEVAPAESYLAVPGQVAEIGNGFVDILTGDGKLRVREVEYKGRVGSPDIIIKSIRKRLE